MILVLQIHTPDLHDVQDKINAESIDPETEKPYFEGDYREAYDFVSFDSIVRGLSGNHLEKEFSWDVIKRLARKHKDVLLEAIEEFEYKKL